MEGLAGDLGTMPFPDLILYLGNKGATGTLVCEHRSIKKSLALKQGEVINAASNDPREYLGQFLINFGHITEEQLSKAFQTQAETKIFLGRILVMIGHINEDVLRQVLMIKIRESTLGLCRWKEGTFRFARGLLPPEQDEVEVHVPLIDIYREAEFRETAWQAITQVFPSGNLTLKVHPDRLPKDLLPTSLDYKLIELMQQGHAIDEISLRLHATDFHLYQRLYALFRQQMIEPVAPAAKDDVEVVIDDKPEDEGDQADVLQAARVAMSHKRWADAEMLAGRAAEARPTAEALAILKEAETRHLEELRSSLLDPPKVPRLSSNEAKLKSLALSAQEKYLLSRIDGARDVKSIIGVSPVRELDALRCFRRFVDEGLVVLG